MKINNLIKIFLVSLCFSVLLTATPCFAGHMEGADGSVVTTSGKTMSAASGDCEAVASLQKKWEGCIFCVLYKALFVAAKSVGAASSKTFGQPFANLLAIGMALFIAYETLKMVSSFTQQDIRKYLNTVSIQFFSMLVAFLLLKNMGEFYYYIVNPLLLAGFDFGSAVAELGSEVEAVDMSGVANSKEPTFSDSIYAAIESFSRGCQAKIAQVMAFGRFLLCFSWGEGWQGILPDFSILINGVIIFVLGTMIMLSFGFLLIDAVVQMGIFGALAPFCIASWPFKLTKKYTSAGWAMFSGVFLTYAMAGVTLKVVFAIVAAAISSKSGSITELANLADNKSANELKEAISGGFISVLVSMACAVIAFKLTGKISELVSQFGGSAGPGIGSDMGKQAMTAASNMGKSAAGTAAKGAKAFSDASGLTEAAQKAREKVGKGINKVAHAPSRAIKAALGSKTAAAIHGQLKDTFIDTPKENIKSGIEDLKATKAGQAITSGFNKFANSKVGMGLNKVAKAIKDPNKAIKKADEKIADFIGGDKPDGK